MIHSGCRGAMIVSRSAADMSVVDRMTEAIDVFGSRMVAVGRRIARFVGPVLNRSLSNTEFVWSVRAELPSLSEMFFNTGLDAYGCRGVRDVGHASVR